VTAPDELPFFDTSVWVRYLRPRGAEALKVAVRDALARGQVATCGVVRTELLIGARDSAAFDVLLDAVGAVTDVPITDARWVEAARLGQKLRRQGLIVPLPDLLIAQCAISSGRVLWHLDEGYERIKPYCSLRTRAWQVAD
jgi:predicted nucleic acid-binding protein